MDCIENSFFTELNSLAREYNNNIDSKRDVNYLKPKINAVVEKNISLIEEKLNQGEITEKDLLTLSKIKIKLVQSRANEIVKIKGLSRLNEIIKNATKKTIYLIKKTKKSNGSELNTTKELVDKSKFYNIKKIDKVVSDQLLKINEVETLTYVSSFEKFNNSIVSVFNSLGSFINKKTILTGASKKWDPVRLLAGKHESFDKIGAEHIQLTTKLGDKIDATYLEASSLVNTIEEKFSGKKCSFKSIEDRNKFRGNEVGIRLSSDKFVHTIEIDYSLLEEYSFEEMENFYINIGMVLLRSSDQNFYAVNQEDLILLQEDDKIDELEQLKDISLINLEEVEKKITKNSQPIEKEFVGYYFETFPKELQKTLANLNFEDSPWSINEIDGKGYLIRKSDEDVLYKSMKKDVKLEINETKSSDTHMQGTVILTTNQTSIYEQHGAEFLTFALEGVNVMAYNNGGKGLSKGSAAENNINEAIEAAYQYVSQIKLVPDEKILAKGQCFGGAPTAWLSSKHPNINVMLDQTPANFHETSIEFKNKKIDDLLKKTEKDSKFFIFIKTLVSVFLKSFVVDSVIRSLIAGYNLDELMRSNRGKQLIHINVPDENEIGGDDLIPKEHPEKLINAMSSSGSLTFNPGGVHVTHWFTNDMSYQGIMNFMKKNNLSYNLYEKKRRIKRSNIK